jgi:signal transduction histidine kinase
MNLKSTLFGRSQWKAVGFLLSGLPLGIAWFVLLVTGWSVTVALAVTPFVILNAWLLALLIRGCAMAEASLARELLDVRVYAPHRPLARQSWLRQSFGWLTDPAMWRAQAYLAYRVFAGFGIALALGVMLACAAGAIAAPTYYYALDGGIDLGFWHVDTLPQALALVPIGVVLFVLTMLLVRPLTTLSRHVAFNLLERSEDPAMAITPESLAARRRNLTGRGMGYAIASAALIVIWAVTGHGTFWPIWPIMSLLLAFGIGAWKLYVDEEPQRWHGRGMSPALALQIGISGMIVLFLTGVWGASGFGYYWPVWTLIGVSVAAAVRASVLYLGPPDREELTQRIETLTTTRAGAVDQQEAELRRIERDLHDGAQARLVALGMSIGMAEQKMATDPEGAREMLVEARQGAGQALKELRDLARGIHPPVLADRGLEAAITALADASPLRVMVHAELDERPAAPVESAAYFVVAETLANAGKHSGAKRVDIRMIREGDTLSIEIADDGKGGADPNGAGLSGLRRRVEALDGTLRVASPSGGPTLIRADMPCG